MNSAVDHDARWIQALNHFGQAPSEFPLQFCVSPRAVIRDGDNAALFNACCDIVVVVLVSPAKRRHDRKSVRLPDNAGHPGHDDRTGALPRGHTVTDRDVGSQEHAKVGEPRQIVKRSLDDRKEVGIVTEKVQAR